MKSMGVVFFVVVLIWSMGLCRQARGTDNSAKGTASPTSTVQTVTEADDGGAPLTDEEEQKMWDDGIKSLGEDKDEILAALKQPDAEKRYQALDAVRLLGLKDAVPVVVEMAENDPDQKVQWYAQGILVDLDFEEAVPFLLERLKSEDLRVRRMAAWNLARNKRKEGVEALIKLLDSEDEDTQKKVFFFLKETTKKDFGSYSRLPDGPEGPRVIYDEAKKKEVFAKWKKWWQEEGATFKFP